MNLFTKNQNEEDTYKAIYRLSIIGVVDDYTVDYNSKTISPHISKKATRTLHIKTKGVFTSIQ
ncbi:MAG: hypothetical protein IPP53_12450 [Bacteroidetes bacterium]|nr:hypothetical protein [Bacteroidota bacterium]